MLILVMVYGIGFTTLMCNEDTRLVYPAESCTTWVNHCFCGVIEPLMGPNWWLSAATFKTTDATYMNLVRFRLFSHPLRLGRNEWGSTASQLDMDILWFPSSYLEHLSKGPKPQMLLWTSLIIHEKPQSECSHPRYLGMFTRVSCFTRVSAHMRSAFVGAYHHLPDLAADRAQGTQGTFECWTNCLRSKAAPLRRAVGDIRSGPFPAQVQQMQGKIHTAPLYSAGNPANCKPLLPFEFP